MRVVAFGEGLVEHRADGQTAYGGDVVNTAVYLARSKIPVDLLTAVGCDPASDGLLEAWAAEGVGVGAVVRHRTRTVGSYRIQLDNWGQRRFVYDRDKSAARAFFRTEPAGRLLKAAGGADLLYLTGVTLSIFTPAERTSIVELARRVREAGGAVAFDPNFRPDGWGSAAEAWEAIGRLAPHISIALPSLDDHCLMRGAMQPKDALSDWLGLGIAEVVLKMGEAGAIAQAGEEACHVPSIRPRRVHDTTAAGDSFNAAYLAARRAQGTGLLEAGLLGAALAARVIAWPGAIMPRLAISC